jgi:hypothetical protein
MLKPHAVKYGMPTMPLALNAPLRQDVVARNKVRPLSLAKAGSARTPVSVATPERSWLALLQDTQDLDIDSELEAAWPG